MKSSNAWLLLFLMAVAVAAGDNAGHGGARCRAAVLLYHAKSRAFWSNSAFVVVRVRAVAARGRKPRQNNHPMPGTFHGPRRVHVLAVLATERAVATDMELTVRPRAGDQMLQGPISAYASGTFLVYMTFDPRRHRWYLFGDVGVAFMPRGLESARVSGLSDPLVKKVAARVHELISHAHRP